MAWTMMAKTGRSRLVRPAGVLLGLVVGLSSSAASAKTVTLSYLAYLAGYPVLSLTAEVDMPLTGSGKPGKGAYGLDATIVTQGSLASLYPYRVVTAAHGRVSGGTVTPGQFHSEGRVMSKTESVTLTYGSGGKVDINAVPLTRQAQEAAANGTANGTIDPATLVIAVVAAFAERQTCAGSYKLFDGVRRYDLNVQQMGVGEVQFYKQSFYKGRATECQATPQLLQGFAQMAVESQLYPQSAKLWLAPAVQGFPAIPVRIQTQNALGSMTFDLVGVQ
jgi:hypothetical protein